MLEIINATLSDRFGSLSVLSTEQIVNITMNAINTNNGDSASNPFLLLNCCIYYSVTPFLKALEISLYSLTSFITSSPLANSNNFINKFIKNIFHFTTFDKFSRIKINPIWLVLKQGKLVLIFIVGTNVPNGVPRPVVNKTN